MEISVRKLLYGNAYTERAVRESPRDCLRKKGVIR